MIDTLVLLGAGGDLTARLLLPALASLHADGTLPHQVRVVGADRADLTPDRFAEHVRARLAEHAPSVPGADRDALVAAVHYRCADVADATQVAAVLELAQEVSAGGPLAVYLALPTRLMHGAVRAVIAHGLPPGSRLAVEKPFGEDARTAAELNAALAPLEATDGPSAVYRVDHALAMTVVQALPGAQVPGTSLRWDARDLARVELLWEETLGLEGRASFYDRAGALRDVLQNHLVQLLCTVAASPAPPDETAAGARRAAVLRSVRPLTPDDVRARTRRARYTAGRPGGAGGVPVPDYVAERGVDPSRGTETFAEVVLELDDPRWAGTPFVLRAGKALARRRRGVLVHPRTGGEPVWLDVDAPPGAAAELVDAEPAAYRGVVTDLLAGASRFAVGAQEAELAWRVLTPVLQAWAADEVALGTYPAGSPGPPPG